MTASFNLLDSPWLPCIDRAGNRVEISLRDALVRSHELAELRDESPLVTVALHRLLLAVIQAALPGPADLKAWRALWKAGRLDPKKVGAYLDEWRSRFDLFDAKYPFFQVSGFEITGKPPTPVTKLTHERATGNGFTLFDHTVEEDEPAVTPAVAARWLVGCQSYALGGGVSGTSGKFGKHQNFTHAPMVGGVAVLVQGATLFETLALNTVVNPASGPIPSKGSDRPTWEADRVEGPGERRPRGLMEYLTWRSRMVRLIPYEGDGKLLVAGMHFASGWDLADGVIDPLRAYSLDEKRGHVAVRLSPGRDLWRDSSALLVPVQDGDGGRNIRPAAIELVGTLVEREVLPPESALRLQTMGLANDKAKVLLWRREAWSVPAGLVHDPELAARLLAGLGVAEEAGKAMYAALSRFLEAFKDGMPEVRARGMAAFWGSLEVPFRRFVASIASQGASSNWAATVAACGRDAFRNATDNAQRRSAREFQARALAEGYLNWKLRDLTAGKETERGIA